jgi:hypothetical protein
VPKLFHFKKLKTYSAEIISFSLHIIPIGFQKTARRGDVRRGNSKLTYEFTTFEKSDMVKHSTIRTSSAHKRIYR